MNPISILTGLGLSDKLARIVAYALLALVIFLALWAAKCSYDKHLIANHDATQAASTANADRQADQNAAEARRVDDARLTQEKQQLEGSTANAQTDLDRRLAFQRCLRMQQAARASGSVVPACH